MNPYQNQAPPEKQDAPTLTPTNQRMPRGKLRIYFGACAGVGKTHAMLLAARELQDAGCQVMLGAVAPVESHAEKVIDGVAETAPLLSHFIALPNLPDQAATTSDGELNVDAALFHRPNLILVDQLARSNPATARHPKRWQDIEELLKAGIHVFTTLNVRHIESLHDVIAGITGIKVDETLPDAFFDKADEVVLVDLPVDELFNRLNTATGSAATENEFCKGNLLALRELALRRTADRLEIDVLAYRREKSIQPIWQTNAALLACVGPNDNAEHLIRSAAQLASQLNGGWQAIYVETPSLQRLPSHQRQKILQQLKFAENLGASTAVLAGNDIAATIAEYARMQNLSKIVLGRSQEHWHFPWRPQHMKKIAQLAPDIDITEIGLMPNTRSDARPQPLQAVTNIATSSDQETKFESAAYRSSRRKRYLIAAGASLLTAVVTIPLLPYFDLANIAMLFLLTVVLVSVRFGREASVVATLVGVSALALATPSFSFALSDWQYTVTFLVMLAVGLITGSLTANLHFQARIAQHRESRSRALYEFARALSSALQAEQVFDITRAFVQRTFNADATLLLPDQTGHLQIPTLASDGKPFQTRLSTLDLGVAQWAFDRATPAGASTDTLPGNQFFYLPLIAPMRTRGVLVIEPEHGRWILIPEQRKQLDTFAALAAIALERVHYVEVAQEALVNMESERLRNSLLAALSHDLRTPLTSLVGISEALALSKPSLSSSQRELAEVLRDEAIRMSNLVSNLLDMARIQSGKVKLNLQWQTIEELVGSALRASRQQLTKHHVKTELASDLPLVQFDAILIERLLCNLLENASKYTPAGSHIVIAAVRLDKAMEVQVRDNGAGLPSGKEEAIFEKFTRGEKESSIPGVGLGLAICRAIIEAHGGSIRAAAAAEGGAAFIFSLPLGVPPSMPCVENNDSADLGSKFAAKLEPS